MDKKTIIINEKFPLAAKYDAEWQIENAMGSPCLWLTEAVSQKMNLKPEMKVLDLGCGTAMSSIFLAKEYGVKVFATDLWVEASDNLKRIQEAGVEDLVFPIKAEAHALPYANNFFDAVICINSYQFYGTSDTYFNDHLGKLVKTDGEIGFALAGIFREFDDLVPDYLKEQWWNDFYYFHSLDWWKRHFRRCGTVDLQFADDFNGYGSQMVLLWGAIETTPDCIPLAIIDNGRNFCWNRLIVKKRDTN